MTRDECERSQGCRTLGEEGREEVGRVVAVKEVERAKVERERESIDGRRFVRERTHEV